MTHIRVFSLFLHSCPFLLILSHPSPYLAILAHSRPCSSFLATYPHLSLSIILINICRFGPFLPCPSCAVLYIVQESLAAPMQILRNKSSAKHALQACRCCGESFLMETRAAASWTWRGRISSPCTRASHPNFRSTGSRSGQGLLSKSASNTGPFYSSQTTSFPLRCSSLLCNSSAACHTLR